MHFYSSKMVIIQGRSRRKTTGGYYHSARGKRTYEKGRLPTLTKIGTSKRKNIQTKGGGIKTRLLQSDTVNLLDPKTNKYEKTKILTVLKTPANRHFARRNIITKGTILKTEKGDAEVNSRPGQDGIINAVLIANK